MMSIDDLPSGATGIQLFLEPFELIRCHRLRFSGKELHPTRCKRVSCCRHAPAWAFLGIKDLSFRALRKAVVMVPQGRIKLNAQRIVKLIPPGFPMWIVDTFHPFVVEVIS